MAVPDPCLMSDQSYSEAIGWLVSAVGRDFMLEQVERAEGVNDVVAAQLRDWTERLTTEGEWAGLLRNWRIRQAARAVGEIFDPLCDATRLTTDELAEVALRGAGVIR